MAADAISCMPSMAGGLDEGGGDSSRASPPAPAPRAGAVHRSVTRGVGTTLYMSPEQRANRPYDHKVEDRKIRTRAGPCVPIRGGCTMLS
jgi:hypothetical protein